MASQLPGNNPLSQQQGAVDPGSLQAESPKTVQDAIKYVNLLRPIISTAHLMRDFLVQIINFTDDQIDEAFQRVPWIMEELHRKVYQCTSRKCTLGFRSKVNYMRHQDIHLPSFKDFSMNRGVISECWENFTFEEAKDILSSVDQELKRIHGFTIEESMKRCVTDMEDFRKLPREIYDASKTLRKIMKSANKPSSNELFDVLDMGSDGTFLLNDISTKQNYSSWLEKKEFGKTDRVLEIMMNDMLAIFSSKVEEVLVERWYNLMNAVTEDLQKKIISEETLKKSQFKELSVNQMEVLESESGSEHPEDMGAVPTDQSSLSVKQDDTQSLEALEFKDLSWVTESFLEFLRGFKYGTNKVPFFEVQVKDLKECGSFEMHLEYSFIERMKKELALAIRDDFDRVYDYLKCSAVKYLKEQSFTEDVDELSEKIKLTINSLPQPKSEQKFLEYVRTQKKDLVKVFKIDLEKEVIILSCIGRKSARHLLKYILKTHNCGFCWNGEFDVHDILVRSNGSEFVIGKDAMIPITEEKMVSDLRRYHEILVEYYRSEDIKGSPVYFHQLLEDLLSAPDPSSKKFATFQKYITAHMALMPPLAWSDLICKLHKVFESLEKEHHHPLFWTYRKNHYELGPIASTFEGWRVLCNAVSPFYDVYIYNKDPYILDIQNYKSSYWYFLKFLRNFFNHAMNYTMVDGVQTIRDLTILDLMVASHLGVYVTQLIKYIMDLCKMDDQFSSAWMAFETSDDQSE